MFQAWNRWNPYELWRAQPLQKAMSAYQYATWYTIFSQFEVAFWFCVPHTRRPLRTAPKTWKKGGWHANEKILNLFDCYRLNKIHMLRQSYFHIIYIQFEATVLGASPPNWITDGRVIWGPKKPCFCHYLEFYMFCKCFTSSEINFLDIFYGKII